MKWIILFFIFLLIVGAHYVITKCEVTFVKKNKKIEYNIMILSLKYDPIKIQLFSNYDRYSYYELLKSAKILRNNILYLDMFKEEKEIPWKYVEKIEMSKRKLTVDKNLNL